MTAKKPLYYGAALIGIYLVVQHFQGTSSVISQSSSAAGNLIKSLQGR